MNFQQEAQNKQKELLANLQRYGRKATGRTAAAIRHESFNTGLEMGYEVIGPMHIRTLVYGRGPTGSGAGGEGRPLIESIKEWIAAKGLNLNPYAVTAKIHKQGTALYIHIQSGGQPSNVIDDVFGTEYQQGLQQRFTNEFMMPQTSELFTKNFKSDI